MVETAFSTETIHTVTEANFNYYATPFVHPRRNMSEHDFIYMLQGEWEIGQNDEVFSLEKDSLLILSAGQTHFGASACTPGTKTMYFHATCCNGDGLLRGNRVQNGQLRIQSFMNASENKDIKKLFTLRTVEDTFRIKNYIDEHHPKSAVLAGGGFIGLSLPKTSVISAWM